MDALSAVGSVLVTSDPPWLRLVFGLVGLAVALAVLRVVIENRYEYFPEELLRRTVVFGMCLLPFFALAVIIDASADLIGNLF